RSWCRATACCAAMAASAATTGASPASARSSVGRPVDWRQRAADPARWFLRRENLRAARSSPGSRGRGFVLVVADRLLVLQREPDVVETFEQAALAERVHFEFHDAAIGTTDLLVFQVHGDGGIGAAIGIIHQLVEVVRRDLDRQDAVLEAIVIEDVGK